MCWRKCIECGGAFYSRSRQKKCSSFKTGYPCASFLPSVSPYDFKRWCYGCRAHLNPNDSSVKLWRYVPVVRWDGKHLRHKMVPLVTVKIA